MNQALRCRWWQARRGGGSFPGPLDVWGPCIAQNIVAVCSTVKRIIWSGLTSVVSYCVTICPQIWLFFAWMDVNLCFELLIFHILYLGSYSLFLGFYVSFHLFYFILAAHKWFVNPALAFRQGCRGYGDSHGDSNGYGYGMGMGTVINPHGFCG